MIITVIKAICLVKIMVIMKLLCLLAELPKLGQCMIISLMGAVVYYKG